MTLSATIDTEFSLSSPVGSLMRATGFLAPEDSVERAAAELRRSGNGMVPIVDEHRLLGVVTEQSLAAALADGLEHTEPVTAAMREPFTISPYATAAEALRLFAEAELSILLVVDDNRRLMGILSPSDLYPRRRTPPRPSLVGGMATPFGVYLTNGTVGAGAGGLALVMTGVLMYGLLAFAQLGSTLLAIWLHGLEQPGWLVSATAGFLPALLFLAAMRLIPLSGTHAAEHQVVHAIERGEELHPDIVRRMPRVHPRCGTNLAVGATLFLSIFMSPWTSSEELRLVVAALVTMFFWRRIGSLVQLFITTKPANRRQLESGIRAGRELLEKYATSRVSTASIPLRIWRSGMLHVMAGSFLCYGAIALIAEALAFFWKVKLPI